MVNVIIPPHTFLYSEAATILIGVLILGLYLSHYNVLSSHRVVFQKLAAENCTPKILLVSGVFRGFAPGPRHRGA